MRVIEQALLEKVIIERSRTSHKGDYGRLLLLGGTYPYGGAIIMAALAAVKSGAGLVPLERTGKISLLYTAICLRLWPFLCKTSNCYKSNWRRQKLSCWDLVYETMLLEKIL